MSLFVTMTPQLDAIGIVTSDIARSVTFYAMLGVPRPADMDGPHVESVLPSGLRLMWDSEELIRQIEPGWQKPSGQRLGLAFLCGSPQEVDSVFARVVSAGFGGHKEPWDAFWGQRYAQVEDPDGNKVDLFAPLASA